ncbi:MAG TPA: MarR family transcriptional regulator [Clostridiales bacterium]|nr:MarR family transcriptional regulator [Clostridiales bacterium]
MDETKSLITQQLRQLQILMHRAYHNFMSAGKTAHSPYIGQGRVLYILKKKREISQKELTHLLAMSKQSLAELLSKLEKNGYIARKPSEKDKRSITINLTEEGLKAADEMEDNSVDEFHCQVLDCLNSRELLQFSEYLGRIIKRHEQLLQIENSGEYHGK